MILCMNVGMPRFLNKLCTRKKDEQRTNVKSDETIIKDEPIVLAKGKFYECLYSFNLICHLYLFHLFHNLGFLPTLLFFVGTSKRIWWKKF